MSEREDAFDDFVLDLGVLVGVLVGRTRVHRERDGLRVDFLREIPETARPVLIGRVILPPIAAFELRDQLDDGLRSYAEWYMPEDR